MTGSAFLELIGGVRAAIFLLAALVLGTVAGVQSWRLDTRTDQRDALQKQAVLWEAANTSNVQAIADLEKAIKAWADIARSGQAKADAAIANVTAERDALAKELATRRHNREVIYRENPDAAAWSRARVPAALAEQLRE